MEEDYKGSDYTTCPKCGVQHSTLVRHRCFKPKGQDEKPEFDDIREDADGSSGYGDDQQPEQDGQSGGQDQGKGQGDGQDGDKGQGDGQGDGQDQGDEGKAGGRDGDDDGDGEGKAPMPKPPEPDAPPVVVVCTVMKFAALTAQCAKNGNIEVTLAEDGLFVYGHNGDNVAFDVIPWGEFEKRATLDGEFYVKEIIDAVDEKLADAKPEVIDAVATEVTEEKPKKKRKAKAKPPKLTLPLTDGQRVMRRDGKPATVKIVSQNPHVADIHDGDDEGGGAVFVTTGRCACGSKELIDDDELLHFPQDAMHDL